MNARGSVNTWLILEHPNQLAGMNSGMLFVTIYIVYLQSSYISKSTIKIFL